MPLAAHSGALTANLSRENYLPGEVLSLLLFEDENLNAQAEQGDSPTNVCSILSLIPSTSYTVQEY